MNYEAKIGRRREGSGTNDAVNRAALDEEGEPRRMARAQWRMEKENPLGKPAGTGIIVEECLDRGRV